jgi:hypothetical protein
MKTLPELLATLLESLTAQIRAKGREDDYCSITIQPGAAVAVDFGPEAGCEGMAWVRLVATNPTVSFPNADVGMNNCGYSLAYTVELVMLGPAPVMTDSLNKFVLPTDVEQFEAAMRQAEEMQMMYDAIRAADLPQLVLGDYTPQGPEGGVLGGTWTLQVGGDGDD